MATKIFRMLGRGLRLRCPRCGQGPLYGKPFKMHEHCAHCALKFEREQGYFVGAIYINYAATVAIAVPGFFLLDAFTDLTIDQQLTLWVPCRDLPTTVFPPLKKLVAGDRPLFQPSQAVIRRATERASDQLMF